MIPDCSIVVTTFDLPASFLRECLDSIRAQTATAWEVIVVDDGSADEGAAAETVAALNDPRFRLARHATNRGLGAARNTGFEHASGDLVVPVDGDDKLDPRFLATLIEALREDPGALWSFADWRCFGASRDDWRFPEPSPPACPEHVLIATPGALMRRRMWEEVGGYIDDLTVTGIEDWDFWIGVKERGLSGVHVALPLYLHRRHTSAMSVTRSLVNDHAIRERLYQRHRTAFEALEDCHRCVPAHRVSAFRARGYVTSAAAELDLGHRWRAVRLATRAVSIRPTPPAVRQLIRTIPLVGPASALVRRPGTRSAR